MTYKEQGPVNNFNCDYYLLGVTHWEGKGGSKHINRII